MNCIFLLKISETKKKKYSFKAKHRDEGREEDRKQESKEGGWV